MRDLTWVTIPKFPGYEISHGLEVRRKSTGRIISCFCSDGYLKLNVSHLGKDYKPYLHQLVAWAFVPNPENKPEIHHIDCDPLNNHWDNLQWVTRAEHRRISKENEQVSHKIKRQDVIDIRNEYSVDKEGVLAEKYGVAKLTIYLIASGQARGDVKGGIIHEKKGATKKVIDIETGNVFNSVEELSVLSGITTRSLRRQVSGERYNTTSYRYFGEEHLSREKPKKIKVIPFIPYSFGVIGKRKRNEYVRSQNPKALWKKVIQYTLYGEQVGIHESIRKAALSVNAKEHKELQKLLNGRKGKTYKGFIWRFAD
jgi:hypothetical protein